MADLGGWAEAITDEKFHALGATSLAALIEGKCSHHFDPADVFSLVVCLEQARADLATTRVACDAALERERALRACAERAYRGLTRLTEQEDWPDMVDDWESYSGRLFNNVLDLLYDATTTPPPTPEPDPGEET